MNRNTAKTIALASAQRGFINSLKDWRLAAIEQRWRTVALDYHNIRAERLTDEMAASDPYFRLWAKSPHCKTCSAFPNVASQLYAMRATATRVIVDLARHVFVQPMPTPDLDFEQWVADHPEESAPFTMIMPRAEYLWPESAQLALTSRDYGVDDDILKGALIGLNWRYARHDLATSLIQFKGFSWGPFADRNPHIKPSFAQADPYIVLPTRELEEFLYVCRVGMGAEDDP